MWHCVKDNPWTYCDGVPDGNGDNNQYYGTGGCGLEPKTCGHNISFADSVKGLNLGGLLTLEQERAAKKNAEHKARKKKAAVSG